jgi:phage antirepressor YoqD-like protein
MEKLADNIDGTIIYPSRSVAYQLRIGRNIMLRLLRQKKILDRDNLPIKMDRSLYRIRKSVHNGVTQLVTYYTDAGVMYVNDLTKELPKKLDPVYMETELSGELLEVLNN